MFDNFSIEIVKDTDALSLVALDRFVKSAKEAISAKGFFSVALSGGATPKSLFKIMTASVNNQQIDWPRVKIFWGDERFVPHSDPKSNYLMAKENLLDKVPIDTKNIFAIPTKNDAKECAKNYQQTIIKQLGSKPGECPSFDLIYLGLGPEGHTASLFPGTKLVDKIANKGINSVSLVEASFVDKFAMHRITTTPKLINCAKEIVFLISGSKKAEIVKQVLREKYQPNKYPVQFIKSSSGKTTWLIDEEAASLLD